MSEALGASPAQVETGTRRLVYSSKARRDTLARDTIERRLLVVADIAAAAIALFIFVPLLGDDTLTLATLAGLPIVVLMSKIGGLYDRDDLLLRKTTLEEVPALFRLATLYALVIWLLESVYRRPVREVAGDRAVARHVRGDGGDEGVCPGPGAVDPAPGTLSRPRRPGSAERIRERLAESRNIDAEVCARCRWCPDGRRTWIRAFPPGRSMR